VTSCGDFSANIAMPVVGGEEKQIAHELARSPHTVHTHVKSIYRNLGVSSRGELLSLFVR
jgi:DNA-binding NarL/FixJ family response regulator